MAQAPANEKKQGVQVARICEKAPAFDCVALLPDGSFKNLKLSDFQDQWLVLFFYPLDFTFVCPTEIIEFSDKSEEFEQIGCKVVGSSVDSQFTHLAWTDTPRKKGGLGKMNIPLLGDVNRHVAKSYGVLLNDVGHTCRGTFIIDNKGIIRHMSMNDPPVGRNVDEVLRLVKGYQFADKNGEVCPAKWQPSGDNKATIKPDPKAKMEYFEQANK